MPSVTTLTELGGRAGHTPSVAVQLGEDEVLKRLGLRALALVGEEDADMREEALVVHGPCTMDKSGNQRRDAIMYSAVTTMQTASASPGRSVAVQANP